MVSIRGVINSRFSSFISNKGSVLGPLLFVMEVLPFH